MNKIFGLLLIVMALASTGCNKTNPPKQEQKVEQTSVNKAFAFQVQTLDGKTVTLDDYKGKVLLLNFWDTWCPPCRAEIPDFIDLYREYKDQGFEILGVAGGRNGIDAVKSFTQEYGINYPIAIANREIFDGFGGIYSIPTTFIIDQQGGINQKIVGLRPRSFFESTITSLLPK